MKRSHLWFSRLAAAMMLLTILLTACGPVAAGVTAQATRATSSSTKTQTPIRVLAKPSVTRSVPTPTPTPTPLPLPTLAPTTPPVAPTAPSGGVTGGSPWQLVLSDDFTSPQLNSQWITYNGPHGGGNSYYDPSEITVQNGILHIAMDRKTTNGLPFTSGGMAAMRLASTYGKYEFRARLPHGAGVGPYAILWAPDSTLGDVQVDLFESPPVNKDKVYFTNHGNGDSSQIIAAGNFADAYHTFTYEWTPGRLHFLIDGVDQGSLTKSVPNFPMWFGIAVACGDAFTGSPDSTTVLPASLDIDWINIYKYTGPQ